MGAFVCHCIKLRKRKPSRPTVGANNQRRTRKEYKKMKNIKIDLIRLNEEEAEAQGVKASHFVNGEEMTEVDRLARDILAPLAVDALFTDEGNYKQQSAASFGKLGRLFADVSAACGGAVWFCGSQEEAESLTLADGFRPLGFGQVSRGGCFVLILKNNQEKERAYLVRPSW